MDLPKSVLAVYLNFFSTKQVTLYVYVFGEVLPNNISFSGDNWTGCDFSFVWTKKFPTRFSGKLITSSYSYG